MDVVKLLGPTFSKMLHNLNVSPEQMLMIMPSGYAKYDEDEIHPFLEEKEVTLFGRVARKGQMQFIRHNLTKFVFYLYCQNEEIECVVFNRKFLAKVLTIGREVIVCGKYSYRKNRLEVKNIIYNHLADYADKIMPKYHLPEAIKGRIFRKYMRMLLDYYINEDLIKDIIPQQFIEKYHLGNRQAALENIHFPITEQDVIAGLRYFKYEEYLIYALNIRLLALESTEKQGKAHLINFEIIDNFIATLPYKLTADQLEAIAQINSDLTKNKKMFRLLQGDVSSGKTIVALTAAVAIISGNNQVAYMAPTELLAMQIYRHAKTLLPATVNIALLTSSTTKKEKESLLNGLKNGDIDFIIGTHALIEDNVCFSSLALTIIDEQQRFGVLQRSKMINKFADVDTLIMSATPVPRTLAMIIYGHSDISTLQVLPYGKRNVETKLFPHSDIIFTYKLVKSILDKKQQVIIVCPLINESLTANFLNVANVFEKLKEQLANTNHQIAFFHSQVAIEERTDILKKFADGAIDVLISTVVIEVGIDIATLNNMIILDAECFGMAQIHQLRGRIGRSGQMATCYLCTASRNLEVLERLKFIASNDDGFAIAEYDLKRRGPGELLGVKQSGKTLIDDNALTILKVAQEDATTIINNQEKYQDFIDNVKNNYQDKINN